MKLYACKVEHKPYRETNEIEITENIFVVDGYSFGDRLLDGVLFEVEFKDDKVTNVKVEEASEDYFDDLNTVKWLKIAKDYAQRVLDDGDEVDIPDYLKKKYYINRNVAYLK